MLFDKSLLCRCDPTNDSQELEAANAVTAFFTNLPKSEGRFCKDSFLLDLVTRAGPTREEAGSGLFTIDGCWGGCGDGMLTALLPAFQASAF